MKIFNESGKGYWMEGFGCIRTEGENRPGRPNHVIISPIVILNDQGGSVMNISEDVSACLRAQEHGHQPVVCLNFQGSKSNNVITEDGKSYSLNSMHGHDVHVVCFEPGIMRRDCSAGNRAYINICSTLRAQMGDNQPAVAYALDHVITTGANCTAQGPCVYKNICPTEKAGGVHAVCYEDNDGRD